MAIHQCDSSIGIFIFVIALLLLYEMHYLLFNVLQFITLTLKDLFSIR